jgi:hypothetical protein
MCIQRIQEAKLVAKKEGRTLKDGEIKLACQQSCSSDAIVFGDLKDPEIHDRRTRCQKKVECRRDQHQHHDRLQTLYHKLKWNFGRSDAEDQKYSRNQKCRNPFKTKQ